MKNSVIYLTRRCPRHCTYCKIRDAIDVGKELSPQQWGEAFQILKELKVEFNLILGNEPWLLRDKLPEIMKHSPPYALYTSGTIAMFNKYKTLYFGQGGINNFSTGVDFPILRNPPLTDDSYRKSAEAWNKITWIWRNYPNIQVHATITVHKLNLHYLPLIVRNLTELGAFANINFIHWNRGGQFDFFPDSDVIEHLLFTYSDYPEIRRILNEVLQSPGLLQNPEMLEMDVDELVNMGWHCKGDPYGGPTVDADGVLRTCGYRKGTRTPKFTIFDLPKRVDNWKEAVYKDAMECPGCSWSCPWMFRFWAETDSAMGSKVFEVHAIKNKSDEKEN